MLCVSATAKTTAGALGLSDTKETMRATLEIALLLLAGYFTLTDGVSELAATCYTTDYSLTHTSSKTSTCYVYSIYTRHSLQQVIHTLTSISTHHTYLRTYITNHDIILQNYTICDQNSLSLSNIVFYRYNFVVCAASVRSY